MLNCLNSDTDVRKSFLPPSTWILFLISSLINGLANLYNIGNIRGAVIINTQFLIFKLNGFIFSIDSNLKFLCTCFCNATSDWITSKICDSISCDILSEIV